MGKRVVINSTLARNRAGTGQRLGDIECTRYRGINGGFVLHRGEIHLTGCGPSTLNLGYKNEVIPMEGNIK